MVARIAATIALLSTRRRAQPPYVRAGKLSDKRRAIYDTRRRMSYTILLNEPARAMRTDELNSN